MTSSVWTERQYKARNIEIIATGKKGQQAGEVEDRRPFLFHCRFAFPGRPVSGNRIVTRELDLPMSNFGPFLIRGQGFKSRVCGIFLCLLAQCEEMGKAISDETSSHYQTPDAGQLHS